MIFPIKGKSQCKDFAGEVCKEELAPYTLRGNYDAAILTEGETVELHKTFYANENYRIYICESAVIPKIRFQVMDDSRNVIYDNKHDGYKTKWDFAPESTEELIISLKADNFQKDGEDPASGCIAVMVGIKD
ncbi:MAG: hypothetical protein ACLFM7_04105 [Bacteroidales bacterium]